MSVKSKIEQNIVLTHQWFDAFNSKNLEELLKLYHENARHYSPKLKLRHPATNGYIEGKDSLRGWWYDAFERLPSLKYDLQNIIANETHVFMDYHRYVEGETMMQVGEVLEIENGLISFSKVYHG